MRARRIVVTRVSTLAAAVRNRRSRAEQGRRRGHGGADVVHRVRRARLRTLFSCGGAFEGASGVRLAEGTSARYAFRPVDDVFERQLEFNANWFLLN